MCIDDKKNSIELARSQRRILADQGSNPIGSEFVVSHPGGLSLNILSMGSSPLDHNKKNSNHLTKKMLQTVANQTNKCSRSKIVPITVISAFKTSRVSQNQLVQWANVETEF